jgi:hypothetical protein
VVGVQSEHRCSAAYDYINGMRCGSAPEVRR